MLADLEDEALVDLYKKSPPIQQEEIYNKILDKYYYFIVKSCRSTLFRNSTSRLVYEGIEELARDIAHDFLVEQMHRVIQRYDAGRGSFKTWLTRCVINFTIDALRRRPKGEIESFQIEEEEWKSYYLIVEVLGEESIYLSRDRRELQNIITRLVRALPEHYQKPLWLRFWEGLSVEEVARELRLPLGTVKSQLSRAVGILRQRLQAEGLDKELRSP
ncbi:MAG: sigma-70 family RNA polymerase sigma factor [Bacteroidia bacterium]|nr:sigma-70 family RNA polymerase sigma factor [Bacteroidia bacterium]MDW8133810.1 sigma-70 family RNA polymerase sigma factor [Bacteroidia bacterium]